MELIREQGCWCDQQEEAVNFIVRNSFLDENDARWVIEWLADDPIRWAEKYAPYLVNVTEAEADENEAEYGEDVIIFRDDGLTSPVMISVLSPNWY